MRVLKQYLPALGMVLATVLGSFYVALQDNTINASEWFMVGSSGLGAVTVYIVPRVHEFPLLKTIVAGLTLAFSAAGAAFITDGISGQEWVLIVLQLLAGLGVVATGKQVPLTPDQPPAPVRSYVVTGSNVQQV